MEEKLISNNFIKEFQIKAYQYTIGIKIFFEVNGIADYFEIHIPIDYINHIGIDKYIEELKSYIDFECSIKQIICDTTIFDKIIEDFENIFCYVKN